MARQKQAPDQSTPPRATWSFFATDTVRGQTSPTSFAGGSPPVNVQRPIAQIR